GVARARMIACIVAFIAVLPLTSTGGPASQIPGQTGTPGGRGARRQKRTQTAGTVARVTRPGGRSGVVDGERADVVHLPEVDPVGPEDRVRGGHVEVEVRARDLEEVVGTAEPLALEPRRGDAPVRRPGIRRRRDALEIRDARPEASAQLVDRLLGVRMRRRLL